MPRTPRTNKKGSGVSTRPAWPDRFLQELKARGTISAAAKAVKVGRRTVYDELERNPDFAELVREARVDCADEVESTLYQRALAGDNTCLIFYLKGNKPEVYGDGLRVDQIRQIRDDARQQAILELQAEIERLPKAARDTVLTALARTTRKELAP